MATVERLNVLEAAWQRRKYTTHHPGMARACYELWFRNVRASGMRNTKARKCSPPRWRANARNLAPSGENGWPRQKKSVPPPRAGVRAQISADFGGSQSKVFIRCRV